MKRDRMAVDRGRAAASPTSPDSGLVPCPACTDDRGEPLGDMLVQLPSGTWVRQVCERCQGLRRVVAAKDDRPATVRPPFDPAEFARESDQRVRAATKAPDPAHDVPGSTPEVQELASDGSVRDALGPDAVPFLVMSREDLASFDLRLDAAKLLTCVDGVSSIEAICAAASIPAEEGASLLLDLAERGVVSFDFE